MQMKDDNERKTNTIRIQKLTGECEQYPISAELLRHRVTA